MQQKTKNFFKRICKYFLVVLFLATLIWANVARLKNNLYANYEKIVDYGRVREKEEEVNPVMAAIFYDDKVSVDKNISTYFNHYDNYKKKNVKIVVISKEIKKESKLIIKKLFAEIHKNNKVTSIVLVNDNENDNLQQHIQILKKVMQTKNIEQLVLTEDDLSAEKLIEDYLGQPDKMIVMLTDITSVNRKHGSDFLLEEVLYFAQKNSYHMEVFDVVDTQIARAMEKDYSSLLLLTDRRDLPQAEVQKNNLELYAQNYKEKLFGYFKQNLNTDKNYVWPKKTTENYRLFDRGRIYVRVFDEELSELFARKNLRQNSVIVSLIEIAKKTALKTNVKKIKYIKIYLLTDLEEIHKDKDTLLISYLDQDDGVMAEYKNRQALLCADERPDDPTEIIPVLRQRGEISADVPEHLLHFYKFKTVEMNDEN